MMRAGRQEGAPGQGPELVRRERRCATLATGTQREAMDILAQLPRGTLRRKHSLSTSPGLGLGWDLDRDASSVVELPRLYAMPKRRQKQGARGDSKSSGAALAPNSDDLPDVPKGGGDDIGVACAIVEALLQQGVFRSKEKQQMHFVLDVLQSCASKLRQCSSKDDLISMLLSSDLDEQTREYLKNFAATPPRGARKTLRQIAQAVIFTHRLRGHGEVKRQNSLSLCMGPTGSLQEEVEKLDSWDDFDVFQLDVVTDHSPLSCVAMSVVRSRGLSSYFALSQFHSFVREIEGQYHERPYHNRLHAADVTQSVHVMLGDNFTELHAVATIFAAICHDVGHPGVTNAFRVTLADELAITYNDKSVNENMHAAIAYRTLQLNGCGCFANVTKEQYTAIRKLAIELILGTDMATHFDNHKLCKRTVDESGPDPQRWEHPAIALQWMVHTADICSTARPFATADLWTDRLLDEFFLQGDRERELGLPVSPLCDRQTANRTTSQLGFVNFIVKPSLEMLQVICDVKTCMEHLDAYVDQYKQRLAQEKDAEKQNTPDGGA